MRHTKRGDSFGFLYEHRQGNHSVHVTIEPTNMNGKHLELTRLVKCVCIYIRGNSSFRL